MVALVGTFACMCLLGYNHRSWQKQIFTAMWQCVLHFSFLCLSHLALTHHYRLDYRLALDINHCVWVWTWALVLHVYAYLYSMHHAQCVCICLCLFHVHGPPALSLIVWSTQSTWHHSGVKLAADVCFAVGVSLAKTPSVCFLDPELEGSQLIRAVIFKVKCQVLIYF